MTEKQNVTEEKINEEKPSVNLDGMTLVEGTVFKFEKENEAIRGILISIEDSASYNNKVYKIETKEGVKVIFGTTVLDSRMSLIPIGSDVAIVYKGEEPNKKPNQNPIKIFDVYRK